VATYRLRQRKSLARPPDLGLCEGTRDKKTHRSVSCILIVNIVTLKRRYRQDHQLPTNQPSYPSKKTINPSKHQKQVIKSSSRHRRRRSVRRCEINSIRPRKLHRNIGINIRQPRHRPRPRPTITLMLALSLTRQPLKQQDPRRDSDISTNSRSNADRSGGVASPRAPRVPLRVDVPHSIPAHARTNSCNRESATAATSVVGTVIFASGRGFFKAEDYFDRFFVFDDFRVAFGEVARVFPERVVAAEDVDQGQDDLVGRVVEVNDFPLDAFVSAAEVDFVEDLTRWLVTCRE
jgi:hypothetical protein